MKCLVWYFQELTVHLCVHKRKAGINSITAFIVNCIKILFIQPDSDFSHYWAITDEVFVSGSSSLSGHLMFPHLTPKQCRFIPWWHSVSFGELRKWKEWVITRVIVCPEWLLNQTINTHTVSVPSQWQEACSRGRRSFRKRICPPMFQMWGVTTGICFWIDK